MSVNKALKDAKLIEDTPKIGTRLVTKVPIPKDKVSARCNFRSQQVEILYFQILLIYMKTI